MVKLDNENNTVTMGSVTFYIYIFVMLISLAGGAYGLSKSYTDSQLDVVNTRIDGVETARGILMQGIDDKLKNMDCTLQDIKADLRDIRGK